MEPNSDVMTSVADGAATVTLCVLGVTTGSAWWWVLAGGWAYLTYRQLRLTNRSNNP